MTYSIVLDTNVWISGIFFAGGTPSRILQAWRDKQFEIICTPEVLAEIEAKLREKTIEFGADLADAEGWIDYIHTYARIIQGVEIEAGACRDPKDEKFLAAAIGGGATHIVSGDRDLQAINEYQGIKILSPRSFYNLLLAI
jgi:putative PIN family toxin of toxin-antitoxin system